MKIIKGRARKFGDNIDTDIITSGKTFGLPINEAVKYAFEPIFPEFYKTVKTGDIIVAGEYFGRGSSREQAAACIKELKINYIIADSIARIYFRNCVALGIYPIQSKGVSNLCEDGDEIEIDFNTHEIRNTKTKQKTDFRPLNEKAQKIINAGGILKLLKQEMNL